MTPHLVVIRPFLNFVRGDIITDSAQIAEILKAEYTKFVTRIAPSNASKG
jgi:hypothetical protein